MLEQKKRETFYILKEKSYDNFIYNITKFNINNIYTLPLIKKVTLNIGFLNIQFNKKKILSFFLLFELLTGQKPVKTKSKKNVLLLKIRRGLITGCKVTLRKKTMYNFFDTLLLFLPRLETFNGFNFSKMKKNLDNSVSFSLQNLNLFYGIHNKIIRDIKKMEIIFTSNTTFFEKKVFFLSLIYLPIFFKNNII